MRSLQTDAIRSLWSQVQKLSSTGAESVMTQSMPNGLISSPPRKQQGQGDATMSMSCTASTFQSDIPSQNCSSSCSKEIQLLRESMSTEIAQLRDMISRLRTEGPPKESSDVEMESGDFGTGAGSDMTSQPQRPFSLNIGGMTGSVYSQAEAGTIEITDKVPEKTE